MASEPNARAPVNADPAMPGTTEKDKSATTIDGSKSSSNPAMPGASTSATPSRTINLPNIPLDLKTYIKTGDSILTRLGALLRTPGGLQSFLGTLNYTLYVLAHLHSIAPTRATILRYLSSLIGRPSLLESKIPAPSSVSSTGAATPFVSPIIPLALTISDLRTTLRLIGLIPLYGLMKSLLLAPPNSNRDGLTHKIQIFQAFSYMGFQFFENVYHLTNKTILPASWTNSKFARLGGNTALMTWSCRAWLSGITCDFLRLAREYQLRNAGEDKLYNKMSMEERETADRKWWAEFMVAASWYPMAWHYSVEGGIGLSLGAVGLCGVGANIGNFLKLWQATAAK